MFLSACRRSISALDYKLPDGTPKHQDEIIEVPVKGKAELNIASITTEPKTVSQGDDVTLIIRLENTGTDTAKSVSASIDLPMDGSKEAFIGKIQPNNDAPAIFSVKVQDAGDLPYALNVTYNDEWGQHSNTDRSPSRGETGRRDRNNHRLS